MNDPQAMILAAAAGLLLIALFASMASRIDAARTRNVKPASAGKLTLGIDCNTDAAREAILQLTADYERLNREMERADRNIAAMKARAGEQKRQVPPRQSPPAPPPAPAKRRR